MELLTLDELKAMPSQTVIKKGYGFIKHWWFSPYEYERQEGAWKTVDENGMTKIKFIAIRGGIWDWAIYCSLNFSKADCFDSDDHLKESYEHIAQSGAKVLFEDEIKTLVPCTEEAFKAYRY